MIIEPRTAEWTENPKMRAQADVIKPNNIFGPEIKFREFVTIFQNDLNLRYKGDQPIRNLAEAEDPEDSGQKAINYRTEPFWFRFGFEPQTELGDTREKDFTFANHNVKIGADPVTPVFTAKVGTQVRFRLVHPGGHARNNVYALHGHIWEIQPYTNASTRLGENLLSQRQGFKTGVGPGSHFDMLPKNGAGGKFLVRGDYLYRTQQSFQFDGGMWGLFRVNSNRRIHIRAYGISATQIRVEWELDEGVTASNFKVRRTPAPDETGDPSSGAAIGSEGDLVAELGPSATGFTDTLADDHEYQYTVEFTDSAGTVEVSEPAVASTTSESDGRDPIGQSTSPAPKSQSVVASSRKTGKDDTASKSLDRLVAAAGSNAPWIGQYLPAAIWRVYSLRLR